MGYAKPLTQVGGRPDFILPHADEPRRITRPDEPRRQAGGLAPILIVGLLIVSGIIAGGVLALRSQPAALSMIQSALPTGLTKSPAPPVAQTPAAIPPKALARQRPAKGVQARAARSTATISAPPTSPRSQPPATRASTSPGVRVSAVPPDEVELHADPATPAGLYGASDADVTPPELIGQALVRDLPTSRYVGDVVTFELVVNERGSVELVKVNSAPRTLGETMLFAMSLQSIKTWQFRPAVKDGNPVRYRQLLSVGPKAAEVPPRN